MTPNQPIPALVLLILLCCGCAGSNEYAEATASKSQKAQYDASGGRPLRMRANAEGEDSDEQNISNRKIIFSADLSIVVDNFDPVEAEIERIVQQADGFIADAKVDTKNRQGRRGNWTVRIPVSNFDAFLNKAGSIGILVSRARKAEDVTEEYVDIEARIANKKKLEARIIELLERPDDKIQHVIEVERELGRVREEIERMEGRIRFLKDRVELTTVRISVKEVQEYVPPENPGFSNRIARAWNGSLVNTKRAAEDAAVWLVGNLFAIIFWLTIALIVAWLVRRVLKSNRIAISSD